MGADNPFKLLKTTGKIGKPEDIASAKSQGWSPNTSNISPDLFLKKKSQEQMSDTNQKTYLGRSSLLGG